MPQPTYEVVTAQITVAASVNGDEQEFTLTAPTGKKPIAGSAVDSQVGSYFGSRPSGNTWVFKFYGRPSARTADLYLVCAEL